MPYFILILLNGLLYSTQKRGCFFVSRTRQIAATTYN